MNLIINFKVMFVQLISSLNIVGPTYLMFQGPIFTVNILFFERYWSFGVFGKTHDYSSSLFSILILMYIDLFDKTMEKSTPQNCTV